MDKSTADLLVYLMLFGPIIGIPAILLFREQMSKTVAFAISLLPFVLSLVLYNAYAGGSGLEAVTSQGFVFFNKLEWISGGGFDISFTLGMDGISLFMVLMSTLLFPLIILYSWGKVNRQVKLYYVMLMIMETAILGFFLSLDMLIFYIFFELVLIPAIFFIGIWGNEKRQQASMKFFLYTLAGSLLMLIAIIYMGISAAEGGGFTTDYFALQAAGFSPNIQAMLFLAFAISFGIKAPIFPLHTWQADAYSESSITGTVILAAILSKMGVYGFIRFCLPLFPESVATFAPLLSALAVIGIIYGAMSAFAQTDMKRLLAYSSLSHMGFIVLGIFAGTTEALSGSVLQMLAHGISTAGLFFLVGMIEDRTGTRQISDYGGIAKQLPIFSFLFVISVMASVGLPGLSGFVGEFMIMLGAFGSPVIGKVFTILAATGVIIAGVYLLYMTRKVLFGKLDKEKLMSLPDLNRREIGLLTPLVILMFVIGLYATPFLKHIDKSATGMVENVEGVPGDTQVVKRDE